MEFSRIKWIIKTTSVTSAAMQEDLTSMTMKDLQQLVIPLLMLACRCNHKIILAESRYLLRRRRKMITLKRNANKLPWCSNRMMIGRNKSMKNCRLNLKVNVSARPLLNRFFRNGNLKGMDKYRSRNPLMRLKLRLYRVKRRGRKLERTHGRE